MSEYKTPEDMRYSKEHAWVRVEKDLAVVGITDYAQQMLGEMIYVEFPATGSEVEEMGELCVVESAKATTDINAPISGKVAEVNSALEEEPELINQDCYGDAWLVKLRDFGSNEIENLMDAASYQNLIAKTE